MIIQTKKPIKNAKEDLQVLVNVKNKWKGHKQTLHMYTSTISQDNRELSTITQIDVCTFTKAQAKTKLTNVHYNST